MNGLWIPYDLIAREELSHAERIVAAFIASFKRGFTGGNEYIATKLHLEKRTVDRAASDGYVGRKSYSERAGISTATLNRCANEILSGEIYLDPVDGVWKVKNVQS